MDIRVGDILVLKKNHPCGACRWEVLRIGADFKLRCTGCGREVMGARTTYENQITKNERAEPPDIDGKSGNSRPFRFDLRRIWAYNI